MSRPGRTCLVGCWLGLALAAAVPAAAQTAPVPAAAPSSAVGTATATADYVIGPNDVLSIVFWQEKDLSVDVVVRPDGKITLPLLNDILAAGSTPDQLRAAIVERARKFFEEPVATVIVKEVTNNKAFITGQVAHPGAYALSAGTTVLQLIALAGGLTDFADGGRILIARTEQGQPRSLSFNYNDVLKGKHLQQNIVLKAGDTVIVP